MGKRVQQDIADLWIISFGIGDPAGSSPASVGCTESVVVLLDCQPLEPSLDGFLAKLDENPLTAYLRCRDPGRKTTGKWHDMICWEFFFFGVIAQRFQTRKACQCPDLTEPFDKDDLRNFIGIAFGATYWRDFEIIS